MKTKIFLLSCLLLGFGLKQLPAQNGKNGTGAITSSFKWDGYKQPVYCNGETVDYLTGTVSIHEVAVFKDNVVLTCNDHIYGEVTSIVTGEIFRLNEHDKYDFPSNLDFFHFNLVGDKGSHYIGFYIWDMANDPEMLNFIYVKGIFPGNKK
jgi:hypothetical protein